MIHIERLSMHLPAGFEHRATSIALLVGDGLSRQKVQEDISLDSLQLTPQKIAKNISDAEIANLIIQQIVSQSGGMRS